MARTRKTPKPKVPAHERIEPNADPYKMYPLLKELVRDHRPDLADAKIALAWRFGWKRNKDGLLALGKCKKAGDLDKQFHDYDFVIILNNEAWKTLSDTQRRALMHHEIEHAAISEDQNGNPKKDAQGRQMYRVRKHDLEEFQSIVSTYGCYKADIESFVRAAMDSPKPPSPGLFDGLRTPEAEKQLTEELQAAMDKDDLDLKVDVKFAPTTIVKSDGTTLNGVDELIEDIQKEFKSDPSPSLNGHAHTNGNGKAHANGKPAPKKTNPKPPATKNRIKAGKPTPKSKAKK